MILSHQTLKLKTEDSLYEFIKTQLFCDSDYSVLLEFIRFENLSSESFQDFIKLISNSFDFLTFQIWSSFVHCLTFAHCCDLNRDRYSCVIQSFMLRSGFPFDGILSFLTGECGGNVHNKDTIEVSASGICWSDSPLSVVVDFKSNSRGFATTNVTNSWIRIDFRKYRIKPTHYSIRSRTDGDSNHLRSWVVEGSNKRENWVNLDVRENNCDLTGSGAVQTFVIGNPGEFMIIQIRQTGANSSGNHYVFVKSIEFFGALLGTIQ
jgi:hypothetical protein